VTPSHRTLTAEGGDPFLHPLQHDHFGHVQEQALPVKRHRL